jgi:AbiJ N-terminal domain 3
VYNLFVSGKSDAWDGRPWQIELSRCVQAYEYTDRKLAARFGQLDDAAIDELKLLPCVFAFEDFYNLPPRFGAIRDIWKRQGEVQYEILAVDPFLTAHDFDRLSFELDVGSMEMNRTHWAVKEVDLTKELEVHGITLPVWTPKNEEARKKISEVTRRAIIDHLNIANISWSGRHSDDDFLSRLYDLSKLPSHDSRHKTAAGDIWQHTVNNFDDWPRDWVFLR